MKYVRCIHIFSLIIVTLFGVSAHGMSHITNKSGQTVTIIPDIEQEEPIIQELKHGESYTEKNCPVTLRLASSRHEHWGSKEIACEGSYVITLRGKRLHIEKE